MEKAQRASSSAAVLLGIGDNEGACNRAYYAMFDAAKAILMEGDSPLVAEEPRTHKGVIALFGWHVVKPGLASSEMGHAFNRVEELRLIADYKTGQGITYEKAEWAISVADEFVEAMADLMDQSNSLV